MAKKKTKHTISKPGQDPQLASTIASNIRVKLNGAIKNPTYKEKLDAYCVLAVQEPPTREWLLTTYPWDIDRLPLDRIVMAVCVWSGGDLANPDIKTMAVRTVLWGGMAFKTAAIDERQLPVITDYEPVNVYGQSWIAKYREMLAKDRCLELIGPKVGQIFLLGTPGNEEHPGWQL